MKQGVFISHIAAERAIAFEVKSLLQRAFGEKLPVFVSSDYESLTSGTNWHADIVAALKKSRAALILCSRDSMNRPWINFEAGIAEGADSDDPEIGHTHVVPIVIRDLAKGDLKEPLAHKHLRDIHDKDDMSALLKDLERFLEIPSTTVSLDAFHEKITVVEKGIRAADRILDMDEAGFEEGIRQMLANSREVEFGILLEDLRARTVDIWNIPRFSTHEQLTDCIRTLKQDQFIPAMRRLTLLGILLIKYGAHFDWFSKFADCLQVIFETSNRLAKSDAYSIEMDLSSSESLDKHLSHTVPALESLIALYTVAAYALNRDQKSHYYIQSFFPRIVERSVGRHHGSSPGLKPLAFWPLTESWSYPVIQRWIMVLNRYGTDRIAELMGGKEAMKRGVLMFECIVEWNSYLALLKHPAEVVRTLIEQNYPKVKFDFAGQFLFENPNEVMPQLERLWKFATFPAQADKSGLGIDPNILIRISGLGHPLLTDLVLSFFRYIESESADRLFSQQRMPYMLHWPTAIHNALNAKGQ